ncbi:SDR family oxidoreductase [soil metagenome]
MTAVALVTGATGAIGSAIVRRLAEDHVVVIGFHSSAHRARELADELGPEHDCVAVSVDDSATLEAAAEWLAERHGRLDVLVNCAGVTEPVDHDDLDGLTDALIDQIFTTNWRGPFATVRAMRRLLDVSDRAVVINISSVAGVTGQGSNVAYCASKAALDSMTRSLARALGPEIRVVSVSPGWVRGAYADRMPAGLLEAQERATPLRRLATPDDVAAAVHATIVDLWFTTGVAIPVDGGRPLGAA